MVPSGRVCGHLDGGSDACEATAPPENDDGRYHVARRIFEDPELKFRPKHWSQLTVKDEKGQEVPVQVNERDKWANTLLPDDGVQVDETKTVEDLRDMPNIRLRSVAIEQMLRNRTRASGLPHPQLQPAVVNFLDLPMSASSCFSIPVDGLDRFPCLQTHNRPGYAFATSMPHTDFRWALLASQGAISDTHLDAGGLATFVRVLLGRKLWFIGYPDSTDPAFACTARDVEEGVTDAESEEEDGCVKKHRRGKPLHVRTTEGGDKLRAYISSMDGFPGSRPQLVHGCFRTGEMTCEDYIAMQARGC